MKSFNCSGVEKQAVLLLFNHDECVNRMLESVINKKKYEWSISKEDIALKLWHQKLYSYNVTKIQEWNFCQYL